MFRLPTAAEEVDVAVVVMGSTAVTSVPGGQTRPQAPLLPHPPSAAARAPLNAPSLADPPPYALVSITDRYREMLASMRLRITCGKSAIHGLGAIAKMRHKAGERTTY